MFVGILSKPALLWTLGSILTVLTAIWGVVHQHDVEYQQEVIRHQKQFRPPTPAERVKHDDKELRSYRLP